MRRFSQNISSRPARRVVVTGLGCISPLGENVEKSWQALLKGQCGIKKLNDDGYKKLPSRIAATVDKSKLESTFTKSELKSMSKATQLALLAADEALISAKLKSDLSPDVKENTGVCVGMGMFDLSDVYNSYENLQKGYNRVSPFFVPRILANMPCGHISMKYGFRGPNHTASTACATGAHSIGDAFRFIRHGDADLMVCGSGESCIEPLSIAGFCRLRALSTSFNDEPECASRPFDTKRDGFVMGEGAAILVLEELEHAKRRGAEIYSEILGYGLSGDAHHLTSPSEDGSGACLAMERSIKNAQINKDEITYVNAHATSTPTGDKIEAKAIRKLLNSTIDNVLVSSTKGSHGHLLGASGSLEILFVVLACKNGIIPPSINVDNLDPEICVNIAKEVQEWVSTNPRRIALKNSFGFGGTNASLCISDYKE